MKKTFRFCQSCVGRARGNSKVTLNLDTVVCRIESILRVFNDRRDWKNIAERAFFDFSQENAISLFSRGNVVNFLVRSVVFFFHVFFSLSIDSRLGALIRLSVSRYFNFVHTFYSYSHLPMHRHERGPTETNTNSTLR